MIAKERRQRQFLERRLPVLQRALALDKWDIHLAYGPLADTDDNPSAGCEADERYRVATIQFNLSRFKNTRQLERVLLHELLHCLNAPLMHLCEWLWGRLFEETLERQNVSFERAPALLTALTKAGRSGTVLRFKSLKRTRPEAA